MRRLGWALLVFVVVLGGLELLARTQDVPDPRAPARGNPLDIMLHGNPWLLWELQPGDRSEMGKPVHVNDLGFRDRERGPKTRPRALALGDSSVYGFGVGNDELFTARLEAALPADFIDGGVPGYSSYQALNLLDMRGFALDPDLLLVATLWSDNNFDSFTDKELLASYAGWSGSMVGTTRSLLEHSALFAWLDYRFRVGPQGERARKVGWQLGGDDHRTGNRRVQIDDYAANLEAFCERMRARGGGVVFVQLANREDIVPRGAKTAWGPFRQVMEDTATRCAAPLVKVPAAFQASGRSVDALFMDQMHPTAIGHQIMADAIAAELTRLDWPAKPITLQAPASPRPTYPDPFEGKGGPIPPPGGPRH